MGGDIGMEMFPEKYEVTHMQEDPDAIEDMQRRTLADFTPDANGLMESGDARRNTYALDRLNLRADGARTATMPWQNEDYDTQFHDHDPRGWSQQQPWAEYRRVATAVQRRSDFRNDADYSVPETGIAPWQMYQQIRSAQDWTKARMKIFSTSMDNFHAGGVGQYDKMSSTYKSDLEDGTVNPDADNESELVASQHSTTHLSNVVHEGSAALRANSTTDHRVAVSAYGKLYANAGLMPHESQLRSIEDDTPRARAMRDSGNRSLSRLMSVVDGDVGAATGMRRAQQDTVGDTEKFGGPRDQEGERNRSLMLTRDIMALLGFVEQDVQQLRQLERTNAAMAAPLLANLHRLGEVVHAMPAHAKLEARAELLLAAAGGGLGPAGDVGASRFRVEVNPKIVAFMDNQIRRADAGAADVAAAAWAGSDGDVGKYGGGIATSDIFQLRGTGGLGDAASNRVQSDASGVAFAASRARGNYAQLAAGAARPDLVGRDESRTGQISQALLSHVRAPALIGDTNLGAARVGGSATNIEFHDTDGLRRSTGPLGVKSRVRRGQESERAFDDMVDGEQDVRPQHWQRDLRDGP